ncbi:MAG: ATP-binding protein [Fibrobacteria bacterium]|nr:ATP-binding protein [Fibrobacteria bacterium]
MKDTSKENNYNLQFPSDLDYIPAMRQFIAEVARSEGYSTKFCFRTEIIVDELCTNAILHGSKGRNGCVILEAYFNNDIMKLCVKDGGGKKVNIENLKRAVYNSKPTADDTRGRGMDIVQMLADELKIDLDENGNTQVNIVKKRNMDDDEPILKPAENQNEGTEI